MKLENQVCSLELARKLKALGVKQKSFWCWKQMVDECATSGTPTTDATENYTQYWTIQFNNEFQRTHDTECYAAFTVAELGEILPNTLWKELEYWKLVSGDPLINTRFKITYFKVFRNVNNFWDDPLISFEEIREVDARAKMFIWLIENNYIKVEK